VPDRPQAARCRRAGPGWGASRAGPGARTASRVDSAKEAAPALAALALTTTYLAIALGWAGEGPSRRAPDLRP